MNRPLQLIHLYPSEMNIYGDTGNRIVLEKRLTWRDIAYETHLVSVGQDIPKDADIIIGGGGQDTSQNLVADDLQSKKDHLTKLANNGCVMLMVCGMYQLFGRRFVTADNKEIPGINILPVETIAGDGRMIGNISVEVAGVGKIVGYENHSGRTYLESGATTIGQVSSGGGNDGESGFEGCRMANVFGMYMHGPILSKNPRFADLLLSLALERKGISGELVDLDDTLIIKAHNIALSRPR